MRKLFSIMLLYFLAVPIFAFGEVHLRFLEEPTPPGETPGLARVEIPLMHKNLMMRPHDIHRFEAFGFTAEGEIHGNFFPKWKITDMQGFETTIPGHIDEAGLFQAAQLNWGPFKIVAFDEATGLFDEATVSIGQGSQRYVNFIDVSPRYMYAFRGSMNHFWVNCYDQQGYTINCWLDVKILDWMGRITWNVADLVNNNYIRVKPWAALGNYRVRFQDAYGWAAQEISLSIR